MTLLGGTHFALALACLTFGVIIFVKKKGTQLHRRLGTAYLVGMLTVNVTALLTHEEAVGMGPFHWLALLSLSALVAGTVHLVLKQPEGAWVDFHAYYFSWSYVGLLAAGASQLLTKVDSLPRSFQVLIPSLLICGIGGFIIHTRIPRILHGPE